MPGAGDDGSIEKRQNVTGFIECCHGVMVTGDYHQMTAGLLQIHHEAVIQLARIAGGRPRIKDVTRDNNRIDLVGLRRLQQPVQERFMFSRTAFAVKILTEMPVRGVKYAHSGSVAKMRKQDYKRSEKGK